MDFVTEAMLCKVFRPVAGFSNSLAAIVAVASYRRSSLASTMLAMWGDSVTWALRFLSMQNVFRTYRQNSVVFR